MPFTDLDAYKFLHWINVDQYITEDTIIKPEFIRIDRFYKVTYVNEDGSFVYEKMVEYLRSPLDPEVIPTKPSTDKYTYELISWLNGTEVFDIYNNVITEEITLRANYVQRLRKFTVRFLDGDGNPVSIQSIEYGGNAVIPSIKPTKSPIFEEKAFKFDSWIESYTNITTDLDVHSKFNEYNYYYTVTFYGYDTETVLFSDRYVFGTSAVPPVAPERPHANVAYEYYFLRWDKDYTCVESDMVIYAVYAERIKTFTVTFVNGDTTTTQTVNYGASAIPPVGYKSSTDQITYTFNGWDTDYTNVTDDIVVTALFIENYTYYIVNFIDGDGNIISSQKVLPGNDATVPDMVPTKTKSTNSVFIFTTWDRSFVEVEGNLNVKALFKEVDRYYEVNFYNATGSLLTTVPVEYGKSAPAPIAPVKTGTTQFEYVFAGWDKDISYITSKLDVYPQYDEVLRKYEVLFVDDESKVISRQNVSYGSYAVAPIDPQKAPSDRYIYMFSHWIGDYSVITKNTVIIASFDSITRYYEVKFINSSTSQELNKQTVEYGNDAYNPIPYLKDTIEVIGENKVRAIVGWVNEYGEVANLTNIRNNMTLYSVFEEKTLNLTVTFYDDDETLLGTIPVNYGGSATLPTTPTKESDDLYRYEFAGWSQDLSYVTESMIVYAIYTRTNKEFTVTFLNGNGTVFNQQIVLYGKDAIAPDGIPTKSNSSSKSYIFSGWDKDYTNVTSDLIINPLFNEVTLRYTVRFVDENGQTLKIETVEAGKDATPPEVIIPEPTVDKEYFIVWDKSYTNINKNLEIKLSMVEKAREYTYRYFDVNGKVIKEVKAPYGTTIVAPTDPSQYLTEKYVYTFVGWVSSNQNVDNILIDNVDFTPYYSSVLRKFTVKFLDGNNQVFNLQEVEYGSAPVVPTDVPTHPANKQFYYEFRMWDYIPTAIYTNTEIKAIFNQYLQKYTVEFRDETGQHVLKTQVVDYGTGATEPSEDIINMYKPVDTEKYSYSFSAWSRPFGNITEDMVGEKAVRAQYIGVVRRYTYTFYDDDHVTILKQEKVPYGTPIVQPDPPTKPDLEYAKYVFLGWDKVVSDVITGDIDYYAIYDEVLRTYLVVFYDGNGLALSAQEVSYGKTAIAPTKVPSLAFDDMYEYVFSSWDKDFSEVKSDLEIRPKFTKKLRTYKVTFVFFDGQESVVEVEYGQRARIEHPERPGYYFIRWSEDIYSVTKDLVVYPIYEAKDYRITFTKGYDDDTIPEMSSMIVSYDSIVTLPKSSYSRKGYIFRGWKTTPDGDIVHRDLDTFVMQYQNVTLFADWLPITYDIEYYLFGGVADNINNYTIESETIALNEPVKENYKFTGWYFRVVNEDEYTNGMMDLNTKTLKSLVSSSSLLKTSLTKLTSEEEQLPEGLAPINEIPTGTTGNLEIYATYEYNGYIKLKNSDGVIYMGTASISNYNVTKFNLNNERSYSGTLENPIYLFNVYLGQTIGELRELFVNQDLVFCTDKGVVLNDNDVVRTGMEIRLYNGSEIKDTLITILKGDLNGDGNVNVFDLSILSNMIYGTAVFDSKKILSSLLNSDQTVNVFDLSVLNNHVYGTWPITWER